MRGGRFTLWPTRKEPRSYNMELFRKKIERLITDKELRMSFSNKSQIDMDKFELNNIMNKWYHVLGKYV